MGFSVAVTGDSIVNRDFSFCSEPGFRTIIDRLREADVSFTHLETLFHDFDDPEVYPSAKAPRTWVRAPKSAASDLEWAGIDLVSHASNHALDYSYGGLRETWTALEDAGIPYAGTGENLTQARRPVFLDTDNARVALVSMTSSFQDWACAGRARGDVGGRPGVNPLRYDYRITTEMMDSLRDVGQALGLTLNQPADGVLTFSKKGSLNTDMCFREAASDEVGRVLNERDKLENLAAIENAAVAADVVIAHVHMHEFRPGGEVTDPPRFIERFAQDCVEAGADVVVNQGTHAPTRGIEIYDNTPIFYDPGELFLMTNSVVPMPADWYYNNADRLDKHPMDATPEDKLRSRGTTPPWEESNFVDDDVMITLEGDVFTGPGSFIAECEFDGNMTVESVLLHPLTWVSEPNSAVGLPTVPDADERNEILEHVASLSEPYDTDIEIEGGTARIDV
ncbi:CapA family protein [Halostagnicola sp. A-GB9-2]|uniref:CapA family protein n=1 Tax=Halostagnicola sp. A-GB9-2 TaxID=3048066 RepID=UPI0024BFB3CC|nr:CapA family protein [Halostagnicola sp. A-GB9-2]MDJ1433811.1 CapA family protein [Halostagnicola sp. A-GB9-2]